MNTMTNQEVRPLTADELDAVSGGLEAEFKYGDLTVYVSASRCGYEVTTASPNGFTSVTSQSFPCIP